MRRGGGASYYCTGLPSHNTEVGNSHKQDAQYMIKMKEYSGVLRTVDENKLIILPAYKIFFCGQFDLSTLT